MEIKWFRNADFDFKPQAPKAKSPKVPKTPSSPKPTKPKKTFKGPKSPGAYKRKLYIPQKFIVAADDTAVLDEDEMATMTQELGGLTEAEDMAEEMEEGSESGPDPVSTAIRTLKGVRRITYMANPDCCPWCSALNGRTWGSVDEFDADKHNIVKPGTDTKHLAHPNCTCKVRVELDNGESYSVYPIGTLDRGSHGSLFKERRRSCSSPIASKILVRIGGVGAERYPARQAIGIPRGIIRGKPAHNPLHGNHGGGPREDFRGAQQAGAHGSHLR